MPDYTRVCKDCPQKDIMHFSGLSCDGCIKTILSKISRMDTMYVIENG